MVYKHLDFQLYSFSYNSNGSRVTHMQRYRCLVCGQILDRPDFCIYCGAGREQIVPLEENTKSNKKLRYKCLVCGTIIDNPDHCPVCGATSDRIVLLEEDN